MLSCKRIKCQWWFRNDSICMNKNRMDGISRMWRSFAWKKTFAENERKSVSDLCKIGNTIQNRNIVFERERERSGISKKRTVGTMKRVICEVKLIDRKNAKELMQILGITVSFAKMLAVNNFGVF